MPELFLYEDIYEGSAKAFVDQLNASKGALTIRINSGGGSVFEGLAIYNAIKRRGNVVIKIDGLAASIASLIAMGGDRVEMAENALMMIHAPWSSPTGNAEALRKASDLLDKAQAAMVGAYACKTGKPVDEVLRIMADETWFDASEALQHKFIDAIYEPLQMAAQYVGIEKYHLPERILAMTQQSNTPEPKDDVQAQLTELAAIKADKQRRDEIQRTLSPLAKKYPGADLQSVIDDCLNDPDISPKIASKLCMMRLGSDSQPIAANFPHRIDTNTGRLENRDLSSPRVEWGENAHHDDFMAAATDALMIRNNIRPSKPHPAARDILSMALVDMARTMVGQSGGTIRRGLFGIRQETTQDVLKAAMTTSDFPRLLENVVSKSLMAGYDMEPASHRIWVKQTDVSDFKLQKRVALSEAPGLELIPEHGEYKYGAMREKGEGFSLQTFGKIISLTRQAMINDDLDGFTKIPNALGRSAARLEADKVYSILTSNPAMADGVALFHADHSNLMTGAALSTASLSIARAAMRKQSGMNGAILNIVPRYLIVPAVLESDAEQLVASLVDPTKQNSTPQFAWIRGLDIVVDARLDADSETAWYLAADYNQVDTVEIAYLQGQRGAFIDQEQNFDSDNLKIKCRLDFQAAPIDWIGLIKNPGA